MLSLMMVRDILLYMDRTFVPAAKLKSSYDVGMELFLETVLRSENGNLMNRLRDSLMNMINSERDGVVIDRFLVKSLLVDMLLPLGQDIHDPASPYIADFEPAFIERTHEYYRTLSKSFLQDNNVSSYIRFLKDRLQQEEERVNQYMHISTLPKLMSKVKEVLIILNLDAIISDTNCGMLWMLRESRLTDICNLYLVVRKTNEGFERLKDVIATYIRETGNQINIDYLEGVKWVEKVLEFLRAMDTVWSASLEKHLAVEMRMDDVHYLYSC